ncbi:MAG: radical SAM protein [Candidatus Bathyarchaeota archaeon]|nr:MAG: radical SAM protein [Candidatus Bathyarchaeota archaeon]
MPIHKSFATIEAIDTAEARFVEKIRVSSGSAAVLGITPSLLKAWPTTIYLMTFLQGKCSANCGFCSQAKDSHSRTEMLSRVTWPDFAAHRVARTLESSRLDSKVKRVCVQALNYPEVLEDLLAITKMIRTHNINIPISVSCQPLKRAEMKELAEAGVERMGIPLDAATPVIFERIKGKKANGPYDWNTQHKTLLEATRVFGKGKANTHLIVGLGEKESDLLKQIAWCTKHHIQPSLFAFTPIPGTILATRNPPPVESYRRIQLARHLIVNRQVDFSEVGFDSNGEVKDFGISSTQLDEAIKSGDPFRTSGCPDCNRPFYNEKPSGPIYNFPTKPALYEIEKIRRQILRTP